MSTFPGAKHKALHTLARLVELDVVVLRKPAAQFGKQGFPPLVMIVSQVVENRSQAIAILLQWAGVNWIGLGDYGRVQSIGLHSGKPLKREYGVCRRKCGPVYIRDLTDYLSVRVPRESCDSKLLQPQTQADFNGCVSIFSSNAK
jgi:hypothetical protein